MRQNDSVDILFQVLSIGSRDDWLSRLQYLLSSAHKPVAFVVGSGLTRGTVPGVDRTVLAMRGALDNDHDRERLDRDLEGTEGGERYQQAADFLIRNRDQDLLNRVIRTVVLSACRSISSQEKRAIVADEEGLRNLELEGIWDVDPGAVSFGQILATSSADALGPIITTNFDPIIEVAIRRAGGRPNTQYLDQDGRILSADEVGVIDVVHVHGLWRRGDTLHTVRQLTQPRVQLGASLREALRGHAIVVMGYKGWADAFSESLVARIREGDNLGTDVIWSGYGPMVESDFASDPLARIATGSRATFYSGIDLNSTMPELASRLNVVDAFAMTSIRGWTTVTPSLLETRRSQVDLAAERGSFFDGADPGWHHSFDPAIPRLSFAGRLVGAAAHSVRDPAAPRLVVGIGPMGEGKSIALRQCAADLACSDADWVVQWREPGTRVQVEHILALPIKVGRKYLLASDDGDLLVDELARLLRLLSAQGRTDIAVLVVTQERDWRNVGGFSRLSGQATIVPTRPPTADDAQAIVDSWATLGDAGLGELAGVDGSQRADLLCRAAHDPLTRAPDSLMGAMLRVRYGAGLVSRVGDLLERLEQSGRIGTSSLSEAFIMIALAHTAGRSTHGQATPISTRILAKACGLDLIGLDYLILEPLGREAAISRHSGDVWVRHAAIANAALVASRDRDPDAIRRAVDRLVRAAVAMSPAKGTQSDDLYSMAYIGRHLTESQEAIGAARAAVETEPSRFSYRASLISVLKDRGELDSAFNAALMAWNERTTMVDRERGESVFLTTWATVAGILGMPALNVALDGAALSVTNPTNQDQIVRALLGMGVGLTELHSQTNDAIFATALGAVVTLLGRFSINEREAGYLRRHEDKCQSLDQALPVPDPARAIRIALERVKTDAHVEDAHLSFDGLSTLWQSTISDHSG